MLRKDADQDQLLILRTEKRIYTSGIGDVKEKKSAKSFEVIALMVLVICYVSVLCGLLMDFDPMGHKPSPVLDICINIAMFGPLLSVYPILVYVACSGRQLSGVTVLIVLLLVPHLLFLLAFLKMVVFSP